MLSWSQPSANSCEFGGDGGSPITHYIIEWDTKEDFSSPAESILVPSSETSYHLGGRDVITGAESNILEPGGLYFSWISAFNALGSGPTSRATDVNNIKALIGPLADIITNPPIIHLQDASTVVSESSIRVSWDHPALDGGSKIQSYSVDYDTSDAFINPQTITMPVVDEVQTILVESPDTTVEVQALRATVEVINEAQSVQSNVNGVDEIQMITTTCDDVIAEVQTIATTAVDRDEEQRIMLIADDIDEIQLVRTHCDNVDKIQRVTVSLSRVNEVQKLGILISHINTDGDNVNSAACHGINVGEPCQDIEDAISGTFTVAFEFDKCGGGGDNANYCQAALTNYD